MSLSQFVLRRLVGAGLLWIAVVTAVWAQQDTTAGTLDAEAYASWDTLAARAEEVTDRGLASTPALEVLRADIVGWRTRFRDGQGAQAGRITTLTEQLAALGPAPEEGASEPESIATQRQDLEARLAEAEAPGKQATAAFEQASGIIREIDALISERQTDALLDVDPAIVNPAHWLPSLAAVGTYATALWAELTAPIRSETTPALLADNGFEIGSYLLFAFVVLLRARAWMTRLTNGFARRFPNSEPLNRLVTLLLGIVHVGLQVAGLWALGQALLLTGVQGLRATALIEVLPLLGLSVLLGRALGAGFFGTNPLANTFIELAEEDRHRGRWIGTALGLLVAVSLVLALWRGTGESIANYWSVLAFPAVLAAALVLLRLIHLMLRAAQEKSQDVDEIPFSARFLKILARGLLVVAIAGPVLAGIGYANAAEALVWPAILTLALLAMIVFVQGALFDLAALLSGAETTNREALLPTLLGFVVALAALPLFALIWGVRWATLTELWASFLSGVSVGGTVISPTNFLTFAVVFAALYMATRLVQGVLRSTVMPKTNLDSGGRNAIIAGTGYIGVILSAIVAITAAGIDLSGLAIVAGALSVGIGFGLQTIVSNFVSGIILLIERPIKIGDWISVGSTTGYVRAISVRSTRIETFNRQDVIVPNADLIAGTVTNYTLGNTTGRVIVPVGVAYGTDTKRVEAILREIAEAHPMVLLSPPPSIVLQGFGADSLDFEIRAFLRDVNWMLSVKSDMNHEIAARFAEEGIEIPFAQRDVWLRNPEALMPPKPEAASVPETETSPQGPAPLTRSDLDPQEDTE